MKHVLIIEGSLTVRMDLNEAFHAAGWSTRLCSTAAAARQVLRQEHIDCVVLDILLPDGNGLDLVRDLKSAPSTAAVPIILLSSKAEVAGRADEFTAGADDYVGKPYDRTDLVGRAQRLAEGRRAAAVEGSKPLILAVDDSPTYLEALAAQLRQDNYDVVLAQSGEQALEILRNRMVDCILLDLLMPGMSGQEVCQLLKESPVWRTIPVIMLTGRQDSQALAESFEAGADDFVPKADEIMILRARLRAQLRRRQSEQQAHRIQAELHRKNVEVAEAKAAAESEQRMQMALHASHSFTFEWDLSTDRLVRSDSCGPILGITSQAAQPETGQFFLQRIFLDDRQQFAKMLGELSRGEDTCHTECRLVRDDGQTAVFDVSARGSFDASGNLCRLVGVATDITNRKQSEQALERERTLLRTVIDLIPDFIYVKDPESRFLVANDATLRYMGATSPENLLGRSDAAFYPPEVAAEFRADEQRVLAGQPLINKEEQVKCPDGQERVVLTTKVPLTDSAGTVVGLVGVGHEITERKRAEEALRDSQADLNRAQAVARTGSWRLDIRRNELLWSDETYRIFGIPKGTTLVYNTFRDAIHPDDRNAVDQHWHAALRGEPYDIEHRIVVGNQVKWVRERAELEFNAEDALLGLFGTVQDITERKKMELALRQNEALLSEHAAQLEQTVQQRTAKLQETVAELEHYSYSITHDMRAPLRAMQGFANMLMDDCQGCLFLDRRDLLRRIAVASQRMNQLIQDALDYSRVIRNELPLVAVDAEALLHSLIESYPAFQAPNSEITIVGPIPSVLGNDAAMTQCFANLLGNAVKFVAPGTTPRISIRSELRGRFVRIWVEDNGIGIPEDCQERIFEMFRRLSRDYEGTGIGLALVRKVVQRMSGQVGVESECGKGSRFWVELKRFTSEGGL